MSGIENHELPFIAGQDAVGVFTHAPISIGAAVLLLVIVRLPCKLRLCPEEERAGRRPTGREIVFGGAMAGTVTIYGIRNCDTMKKARAWLDERGIAYDFHDYKAAGIDAARLERWAAALGWENLINRGGTTFRKLPEKDREGLTEKKAIALMLVQPSMIKRPVLDIGGKLLVGFKPETYREALG